MNFSKETPNGERYARQGTGGRDEIKLREQDCREAACSGVDKDQKWRTPRSGSPTRLVHIIPALLRDALLGGLYERKKDLL